MEQYLLRLLMKSLIMAVFILAVALFNAVFNKKFPAKLRHAIWLIVLFWLLLPVPLRPTIGNGIITIPLTVPSQTAQVMTDTDNVTRPLTGKPITLFFIFNCVWIIGALSVFGYNILRYIRFQQTIRRWGTPITDEKILSIFRSVQEQQKLGRKKIKLIECGFVTSSMLTGFFRPMVLLPKNNFNEDELSLIFKHEFIHYKHCDLLINFLSLAAVSLHWFNPLVHWLCAAIQTEGESSCDETVLINADEGIRRFYAEIIIGMIGKENTAATMLSTGFYFRSKLAVKKRLDSIMDTTKKMRVTAAFVLVVFLALSVLSGSVFAFVVRDIESSSGFIMQEFPISINEGIEIALVRAGGGIVGEIELEYKNNIWVYDIAVIKDGWAYEIEIDTVTGEIVDFKEDVARSLSYTNQTSVNPFISYEEAISIAASRTGGGNLEEIELEYDMNVVIYEVKIRQNSRLYEVKINAATGAVIGIERLDQ